MFEVMHKDLRKFYTVYAVRVGDDGRTMFLFWDHGWKWKDADDYFLLHEIQLRGER